MHRSMCRLFLGSLLLVTCATDAVWAKDTGAKAGVANTTNSLAGISTQPSVPPNAAPPARDARSRKKKR